MLKKILIGTGAILAILVVVIATRPSTYHIERSIVTSAPAENVFAHVDDFHAWSAWSPFEKMEAPGGMEKTFSGAPAGVGAVTTWKGEKTGEGRMTIDKSERPTLVDIDLEFIKPMASRSRATFRFAPVPEGTKVTWSMDGENDFLGKAFCLVMDMDKMVGGDFERGLADLKAVAEKTSAPSAQTATP